eukprot:symbB.v1.2.003048.t1/scaffold167.1/size289592/13
MSACARAEEWQQSFALFFNAHTLRVTPNVVTFNTAIHAATSEEWQIADCQQPNWAPSVMNQSWFCGYLRSFSATTGYGFVHNEELQQRYSRLLAESKSVNRLRPG